MNEPLKVTATTKTGEKITLRVQFGNRNIFIDDYQVEILFNGAVKIRGKDVEMLFKQLDTPGMF